MAPHSCRADGQTSRLTEVLEVGWLAATTRYPATAPLWPRVRMGLLALHGFQPPLPAKLISFPHLPHMSTASGQAQVSC